MLQITDNTILKRQENLIFNKLDDEVVMMSIANGEYYGLDPVATFIWESLAFSIVYSDLIKLLLGEFDIDEVQCKIDVNEFLHAMQEKDLIVLS